MPCSADGRLLTDRELNMQEEIEALNQELMHRPYNIKKDRGINTDGTREDFVTSLLCTQLRHMAENMSYKQFLEIVIPECCEWFKDHCEKEGGL